MAPLPRRFARCSHSPSPGRGGLLPAGPESGAISLAQASNPLRSAPRRASDWFWPINLDQGMTPQGRRRVCAKTISMPQTCRSNWHVTQPTIGADTSDQEPQSRSGCFSEGWYVLRARSWKRKGCLVAHVLECEA
jgi:hypothetical protein